MMKRIKTVQTGIARKKDKTRQFINRLRLFETTLPKNAPDCSRAISGIEQFGFRYMISRRLMNRMLIRHACPNLDWEYDNGICRIRGKLLTSSCKTAGAVV